MMFVLTTRNSQGDIQEFPFQVNTLEAGLDFISSLAARKETLLSVHIADKDSLTHLPVDAFDGSPLSADIQQLQAEWLVILTKTPDESVSADPWIQQRLEKNAQSTIQHELLISSVRYLLEQLTQLGIANVYKPTLTQRYRKILAV